MNFRNVCPGYVKNVTGILMEIALHLYALSSSVAISTVLIVIVRRVQTCHGVQVEVKANFVELVSPSTSGIELRLQDLRKADVLPTGSNIYF